MGAIGGSCHMEIRTRYLKEGIKKCSFYQYHYPKWKKTVQDLKQYRQAPYGKWAEWADCFLEVFQPVWEEAFKDDSPTKYWDIRSILLDANHEKHLFLTKMNQVGDGQLWREWVDLRLDSRAHEDESNDFRLLSVQVMLGKFYRLRTAVEDFQSHLIRDINILSDVLAIPSWLWADLLELDPKVADMLKDYVESLDGPLFTFTLDMDKRQADYYEKEQYQELLESLATNDLITVERMRPRLEGMRNFTEEHHYVCSLLYAIDDSLLVNALCPIERPFVVSSLCHMPMFQYDVKLFSKISQAGGLWAQIEVAHHLLSLLQERDLTSEFQSMLFEELTDVWELLFSHQDQLIYQWLLTICKPWDKVQERDISMLARSIGQALVDEGDELLFTYALKTWEPFLNGKTLEHLFMELNDYLYNNNHSDLLKGLHQGIIAIWLKKVLARYFNKKHATTYPITFLENPVIGALISQEKNPKRLAHSIKKILDRWDDIEIKWYRGPEREKAEKDALLMALLVFSHVSSNSPSPKETFDGLKERVLFLTCDRRNWERAEDNSLVQPSILAEIERAWVEE